MGTGVGTVVESSFGVFFGCLWSRAAIAWSCRAPRAPHHSNTTMLWELSATGSPEGPHTVTDWLV
jgi:hypothetical protein